jgi:hypothetical protein
MEAEMARDDGTVRFEIDPGLTAEKPAISTPAKHNQSEDDKIRPIRAAASPSSQPEPGVARPLLSDAPVVQRPPRAKRRPEAMSDKRSNQMSDIQSAGHRKPRMPNKISIRVSAEILNILDTEAQKRDCSISQIIRELLHSEFVGH